jgi:hypothetical protein
MGNFYSVSVVINHFTPKQETSGGAYTVKRVDGKLRQADRMTQYSNIRGTEHFFDMQIE